MIKFKNYQLSKDTIKTIENLLNMEINSLSAFKLARVIKHLSSIIDDKNKAEEIIYRKYIIFDESGNPVLVEDENGNVIPNMVSVKDSKEYIKEMNELMEYENIIDLAKLKIEELGTEFNIKPKDMLSIEFIFE